MGGRTLTVLPAIIAPHCCWLGAGRRLGRIAIVQDAGQGLDGTQQDAAQLLGARARRHGSLGHQALCQGMPLQVHVVVEKRSASRTCTNSTSLLVSGDRSSIENQCVSVMNGLYAVLTRWMNYPENWQLCLFVV